MLFCRNLQYYIKLLGIRKRIHLLAPEDTICELELEIQKRLYGNIWMIQVV